MNDENLPAKSEFLVYEAEDGTVKVDVRLENETVWLTQHLMAELFQTSKQNVIQHLKRIFAEGELEESSVVKRFFTTAADGKKDKTSFFNLNATSPTTWQRNERKANCPRKQLTRNSCRFAARETGMYNGISISTTST